MLAKNLLEWSKLIRHGSGKCQQCGSVDDLHAHHIKPKSTHPELILELSNGICLCYRCHKKLHEDRRIESVRIRSNRPRRTTLENKIKALEILVEELKYELKCVKDNKKKLKFNELNNKQDKYK